MALPDYASTSRARELANQLKVRAARFATPLAVTESQDTSGNPLVIVGVVSAAAGAGATIRLRQIDWPLVQDSIGLPQKVYGPHVSELVYEAGVAADTVEMISTLEMALAQLGTRVDIYQSPNGTAADYTQFLPANLKCTFAPSLYFGMTGSV